MNTLMLIIHVAIGIAALNLVFMILVYNKLKKATHKVFEEIVEVISEFLAEYGPDNPQFSLKSEASLRKFRKALEERLTQRGFPPKQVGWIGLEFARRFSDPSMGYDAWLHLGEVPKG